MKKQIRILLVLALVLTLVGCASKKTLVEDPPSVETEQATDTKEDIGDEFLEITLYFANNKYIETGDETLEKFFIEKRLVEHDQISLEEIIVRELMAGPEDTDALSSLIPLTVTLIDVELSDGTAFVNFEQEGMGGGSMQEIFTINQIVNSLTELDSVDRVQFLIDGKVPESLMGHITTVEPFEREN